MRERHTARVQRPYGQNPRRPHGLIPTKGRDTLAHHTDTLANPARVTDRGLDNDVTDTSFTPPRAGRESVALLRAFLAGLGRAGRESGALATTLPACLGYRPWVREPGRKEDQTLNTQNVQSILCLSELWLLTTVPKTVG